MISRWHPGPDDPDDRDERDSWGDRAGDREGHEALLVLFLVLFGGGTLITLSNRLLHYGHTLGVVLFAVLPIVAAHTASTRLHHH